MAQAILDHYQMPKLNDDGTVIYLKTNTLQTSRRREHISRQRLVSFFLKGLLTFQEKSVE